MGWAGRQPLDHHDVGLVADRLPGGDDLFEYQVEFTGAELLLQLHRREGFRWRQGRCPANQCHRPVRPGGTGLGEWAQEAHPHTVPVQGTQETKAGTGEANRRTGRHDEQGPRHGHDATSEATGRLIQG